MLTYPGNKADIAASTPSDENLSRCQSPAQTVYLSVTVPPFILIA